jgi:hypothetical protein
MSLAISWNETGFFFTAADDRPRVARGLGAAFWLRRGQQSHTAVAQQLEAWPLSRRIGASESSGRAHHGQTRNPAARVSIDARIRSL